MIFICILKSFIFLYIQAADFEAMMTVNVTLLLVLTTLFISFSSALPRTSYIKMIDVWLITNLVILFVDIILQTVINYIKTEDTEKTFTPKTKLSLRMIGPSQSQILKATNNLNNDILTEKEKLASLNILSKFILPGFYMTFCVIYFSIGLLVRWESGQAM